MLEVGQVIMYRRNVCTVNEVITNYRDQGKYYKLTPCFDESLVIHAPVDAPGAVFKPLLSVAEVASLMQLIPSIQYLDPDTMALEKTYKDLYESERHEDLVRIIKTAHMRRGQPLTKGFKRSEKDKMYIQKAEKTLYCELAVVMQKSVQEARTYVVDHLAPVTAQLT